MLSGEIAAEFNDLESLSADLQFCASAVADFVARMDNGAVGVLPIPADLRSLWSASVVAYARCFMQGKRQRIDPEIFDVMPPEGGWRKSHELIMALRSKLVAHRVSELETYTTGVYLRPNGEVISSGVAYFHHFLPSRDLAERLHELAGIAYAAVAVRHKEIAPALLGRVKSMLAQQLLALPRVENPGHMSDAEHEALPFREVVYKKRPPVGLSQHGKDFLAAKRASTDNVKGSVESTSPSNEA